MKVRRENFIFKLFVQSSHYVIGTVTVILAGFISMPILTRLFSKSEYGILNLISITLWLTLSFSKAGMGESAIRFYGDFRNGNKKDESSVYYSTLLISAIVFALIMSGISWLVINSFSVKIFGPDTGDFVYILMLMIITGTILTRLNIFFRAAQRTKIYNIVHVLRRYLSLGLGIAFLFAINRDLLSFYEGLILAEVLIILVLGYDLIKKKKIKFSSFSWSFFSESLLFGFPLIVNELAGFLLKSTSHYLLQFFFGSEAVGIYSVGSDLCMYIKDALAHPLFFAIVPLYMELWNNKGEKHTEEFLSKVFYYYSLIAIPVVFGFIALAKQIVITIASVKYAESATVVPYILPGVIIWGYYPLVTAGLYIHKKTKKIALLSFIGVGINIGLNVILIPRMQLQGAALATLITYILLTVVLIKISYVYLKISINFGMLMKIILASFTMFLIIININLGNSIISLIFLILIGVLVYSFMIFLIEKNIRDLVYGILKNQTSKIFKLSSYIRKSN